MEKTLKISTVVMKALTTPMYANCNHQKTSNKHLVGPGAGLLYEALMYYLEEEKKLKFPHTLVREALCNENLEQIFKNLKHHYKLDINDAPRAAYSKLDTGRSVRADLVKALAYAVYFDQKAVFHDIVEEIKKTISIEGNPLYKMKVIVDESGDGFLNSFVTTGLEDDTSEKKVFWAEINYKGVCTKGIGLSKSKATRRACQKWLESNSIPY